MSDYDLYYWSVPFRGQFVRAVLAYAGKTWTEEGDIAISKLMGGAVKNMPVPFMGPPVLIDRKADFAIAEMPAIILYLGETLDLMPETPALRALTMKIVNDANDVIDDITLDGGREMWTEKRWDAFVPRLTSDFFNTINPIRTCQRNAGYPVALWRRCADSEGAENYTFATAL